MISELDLTEEHTIEWSFTLSALENGPMLLLDLLDLSDSSLCLVCITGSHTLCLDPDLKMVSKTFSFFANVERVETVLECSSFGGSLIDFESSYLLGRVGV